MRLSGSRERKKSQKRREEAAPRSLPTQGSILPGRDKKIHIRRHTVRRIRCFLLHISFGHFCSSFFPLPASSDTYHLIQSHQRFHVARMPSIWTSTRHHLLLIIPTPRCTRSTLQPSLGALACLASRPMLFSSAPLLSPPDKGGAEWNPSWNFLALYKLIYQIIVNDSCYTQSILIVSIGIKSDDE